MGTRAVPGKLALMERVGRALRTIGLGRVVDATARRLDRQLGSFELELDGLRLGGDQIAHLYYARELLEQNREAYFAQLLVESVEPGATVLEGGAYIGYVTMLAARAVGPQGRVIVFEPGGSAATLRTNLARNGFADRVRIVEAALGEEAGRVRFYATRGGDTSSLHEPPYPAEVVEVEVVRGDDVLPPPERVDVVKLDVEGSEVQALRGMRELMRRSQPTVFCECNREMLARAGSSVAELHDELRSLDLDVHLIDEETRSLRAFSDGWDGVVANLLCVPNETPTPAPSA
jgi:FkbM family methyltransferase